MKAYSTIVKFLGLGMIVFFVTTTSSWAGGAGKHKSPQQLHAEFMGYAQEYYEKADHLGKKASHTEGQEHDKYLRLSQLNRQMGDLKVEMAKGFLNRDHKAVDNAVQKYQGLRAEADQLWQAKKAHYKEKHHKKHQ